MANDANLRHLDTVNMYIDAPREFVWEFIVEIDKLNLWLPSRLDATGRLELETEYDAAFRSGGGVSGQESVGGPL